MGVPLWLVLVVVGCLLVAHSARMRELQRVNESLADRLDDAEDRLRLSAIDPATGRMWIPRGPSARGWTPRPGRRAEALRRLYSRGEIGEEEKC